MLCTLSKQKENFSSSFLELSLKSLVSETINNSYDLRTLKLRVKLKISFVKL